MGQKVNPISYRIGITRSWDSKWFSDKNYQKLLHEDLKLRTYLKKKLYHSGISKIEIERAANKVKVNLHTARPGIVIGKKGAGVDELKKSVQGLTTNEVFINIIEVRKAEIDAQLIAENVCLQLERRVAFRKATKKAINTAIRFGIKGIKIRVSGRLGGAEMARCETYSEGSIPLHTLRADIDYGVAEALTTYGLIGTKVWVYKRDVIPGQEKLTSRAAG